LLKPKWSKILETQAGGALNGFAVTSKADQVLLSDVMRRNGYQAGRVFVTNSRPMDTSRHEPPDHLDTWMRVLKFDNDLVRNTLIINQGIDNTVLEADNNTASDLLSQHLPNVKQIYTFKNATGDGERLAYASSGAETSGPIKNWSGAPRMQTDKGSQIS